MVLTEDKMRDGDAKKAEWILRIAVFGAFLGHDVFALSVTK